jgi:hypothetical protein
MIKSRRRNVAAVEARSRLAGWLTARASRTPQVDMEPAVQQLVHVVCPPVWGTCWCVPLLVDDQR